ncbi:hypothetical protein JCM8208_005644 [Rhodotorula glutinis]
MATAPVARQLTRAALPLVPSLGFTSAALIAASGPSPISTHTLNALFPSPPPAEPSDWSLRGLAIGNGGRRSRTRHELVALARGEGTAPRDGERTGPARALVKEWLVQGRDGMRRAVNDSGLRGEDAIRFGMRERIAYNEPVLDKLPQALALLSAAKGTYLSHPLSALPVPNPSSHLSHVAHIAQDLAKASGSVAQGTDWYTLRLRLSTAYALAELSLLSPSSSSSSSAPERIAAAQQYADRLLDQGARVGKELENAGLFLEWVRKSWAGIGRSVLA